MNSKHWIHGPTDYEVYLDRARYLRDRVVGRFLGSVWRAIHARVLEPLARRRRRRAAIRALMQLSDRQLKDIGITRGQISEIVDATLAQPQAAIWGESAPAASSRQPDRRTVEARKAA